MNRSIPHGCGVGPRPRTAAVRGRRADGSVRRSLPVAIAVAAGISAAAPVAAPAAGPARAASHELDVLTWSEYLDPAIVAEFEADYDVELDFEYYDSDEERDRRLSERGGAGHDLILVNGEQVERYAARGWLEPIDPNRIPNAALADTRWAAAYPGAERYGVAYFWGTLGIAWRSDLWPAGFPTWMSLLDPDPALAGRIAMSGDGRELVGLALKAGGDSANSADPGRITAAGRLLAAQRPFVTGYGYDSLDADNSLVTGRIVATTLYNGDALTLAELEPAIEFALPAEGGLLWVDYWSVSSTSTDKALASAFLDFLSRPDVAARNAAWLNYVSPIAEARALAGDGSGTGPVLNPSAEQLERADYLRALPPRARKLVNTVAAHLLHAP